MPYTLSPGFIANKINVFLQMDFCVLLRRTLIVLERFHMELAVYMTILAPRPGFARVK
jgi:hypothetical protein